MVRLLFRRLKWLIITNLPDWLSGPILRRQLHLKWDSPKKLTFKRAETLDELEQSFRLTQDIYKGSGLAANPEAELRVVKHHLLPTTIVLIAKHGDEVVATMTLFVDSPLKLPSESHFDLNRLRSKQGRLGEVGALSVKKSNQRLRGQILLPLSFLTIDYSTRILGLDALVIMVHPRALPFYKAILGFADHEDRRVITVDAAASAPGRLAVLNLAKLRDFLSAKFARTPAVRNLEEFFISPPNFIERAGSELTVNNRPILSPSQMEYLFIHKADTLRHLSSTEKSMLSNLFVAHEYNQVFALVVDNGNLKIRRQARLSVFINGALGEISDGHPIKILELSNEGLRIHVVGELPSVGQIVGLNLNVSDAETLHVRGLVRWVEAKQSQFGVEVKSGSPQWQKFVDHLYRQVEQVPIVSAIAK